MNVLDESQIKKIKICGQRLAETLAEIEKRVKPGIVTLDLDKLAEKLLLAKKCQPAFKGYYVVGAGHYPATLCVSINDEIVHGLPTKEKILQNGDIVSLDIGASYEGIFTDMAVTLAVGEIDRTVSKLLLDTRKALFLGIKQAMIGRRIGDIGATIEKFAEKQKLGLIRDYVGHGIGTKPHLPPQIPNFGKKGTGQKILENMALAIEPMLTSGGGETVQGSDSWTVKTADHSLSAHFEHTIIIENGQPVIVTKASSSAHKLVSP